MIFLLLRVIISGKDKDGRGFHDRHPFGIDGLHSRPAFWGTYTSPSSLQPSSKQLVQGQEREEEGSEDIVTEVDNVLGKLMASLQKGDVTHTQSGQDPQTNLWCDCAWGFVR